MSELLALLAIGFLGYALISQRTSGTMFSAPMYFTAFGLLLAFGFSDACHAASKSGAIHLLAEMTLVLVLFTDASRIDLRLLRREHDLPVRLLVIGLPLTIVFGFVVATLLFPELGIAGALLMAAILAPTDAALGQAVVSHAGVPVRIRQTLNVESGLNDGIALPVVLVALSFVVDEPGMQAESGIGEWIRFAALQVLLGPLVGIAVGWGGGALVGQASRSGWMSQTFLKLSALGLAILAFSAAEVVGGNGFLSAFIAGLVLGNTNHCSCNSLLEFGEVEGQLLSLMTFTVFGAFLAPQAFESFELRWLVYAVLSLTVVRMLPVALGLLGKGLRPATTVFLGWFGPRGIASILFALVAVEEIRTPLTETLLGVVSLTVFLSIFAHGMTASPLSVRYARHAERRSHESENYEHLPVREMPLRHSNTRP